MLKNVGTLSLFDDSGDANADGSSDDFEIVRANVDFTALDESIGRAFSVVERRSRAYGESVAELGMALLQMRTTRAYLDADFTRFEDFLRARHPKLTLARARRLAEATRELGPKLLASVVPQFGELGADFLTQIKQLDAAAFTDLAARIVRSAHENDVAPAAISLDLLAQTVDRLKVAIWQEPRPISARRKRRPRFHTCPCGFVPQSHDDTEVGSVGSELESEEEAFEHLLPFSMVKPTASDDTDTIFALSIQPLQHTDIPVVAGALQEALEALLAVGVRYDDEVEAAPLERLHEVLTRYLAGARQ